MSRIGKLAIKLEHKVKAIGGRAARSALEGPKGKMTVPLPSDASPPT